MPHEALDELLTICIVTPDGSAPDEAAVRALAREQLASYTVPRRVLFLAGQELAMTICAEVQAQRL